LNVAKDTHQPVIHFVVIFSLKGTDVFLQTYRHFGLVLSCDLSSKLLLIATVVALAVADLAVPVANLAVLALIGIRVAASLLTTLNVLGADERLVFALEGVELGTSESTDYLLVAFVKFGEVYKGFALLRLVSRLVGVHTLILVRRRIGTAAVFYEVFLN